MHNTHTAEIGLLVFDECTARSGELKLEVGRDSGQKTGKESSSREVHLQKMKGPVSKDYRPGTGNKERWTEGGCL